MVTGFVGVWISKVSLRKLQYIPDNLRSSQMHTLHKQWN